MKSGNLGDFSGIDADRLALIDLSGTTERQLTYGAYLDSIDRVASWFAGKGFKRGARIGLIGRNSQEYLVSYFAIMKCGCVAVPINHRFPSDLVHFVIQDCEIEFVLGDPQYLDILPDNLARCAFIELANLPDTQPFEAYEPSQDEIGMVLYTSGSTGRPKGVPLSHAGQRWMIKARASMADYSAHRILVAAPLCHMNGLLMSQIAAFCGAQVVLLPEFEASLYATAIDKYRCSWITSVPTMLALVARYCEQNKGFNFSCVKIAAMGSAPVSATLFSDVQKLFPAASVVTNYGTTEAGAGIFGPHPKGLPRPPLSLGYPIDQIGFRLVGSADEGILQVKTPAMTHGYINRPDATEKLFTSDGWIHTGDMIRRDSEGFCYFVGREDDMFVCGGENVYPQSVEDILQQHEAVVQACVVAVPDDVKGAKPVAFVIRRQGKTVDADQLKQFFLQRAPAYMHPRQIFFVDHFPLSPTNKIDRSALQSRIVGR